MVTNVIIQGGKKMYDPVTLNDLVGFVQITSDSFAPFAFMSMTILFAFVIGINVKKLFLSEMK